MVSKIAGIATREISGVHEMGAGTARALGAVRDKLPGMGGPGSTATQGVSVEVHRVGTDAVLDITDQGRGIAYDDRDRIFDRFVRLESSRHSPGTGLGLSLAAAGVGRATRAASTAAFRADFTNDIGSLHWLEAEPR